MDLLPPTDRYPPPHDPFLSFLPQPWAKNLITSAFAQAMREASFSRHNKSTLVEDTVRNTMDYVTQTFRLLHIPNPRLGSGGKVAFLLQQQFRGYHNTARNKKQQRALPACVLWKLNERRSTIENIDISQLATGAFFFAMRSCEYLQTNIPEEKRRSRILHLQDLQKGRHRKHSDKHLALPDTVSITFEY